jgi:hypothetical protein
MPRHLHSSSGCRCLGLERIRPFVNLIGDDSFGRPSVTLAGSIYVTTAAVRRSKGTHYTPPSLTEPIVQHTLEPLVYEGPVGGLPRDQWRLKSRLAPVARLDLVNPIRPSGRRFGGTRNARFDGDVGQTRAPAFASLPGVTVKRFDSSVGRGKTSPIASPSP